jgi:hypothetical protein
LRRNKCLYPSAAVVVVVFMMLSFRTFFFFFFPSFDFFPHCVQAIYPNEHVTLPSFIRFGSWIGGDRDGNPYVLPETTIMAALLASRLILAEYIRRCRACQVIVGAPSTVSICKPLCVLFEQDFQWGACTYLPKCSTECL